MRSRRCRGRCGGIGGFGIKRRAKAVPPPVGAVSGGRVPHAGVPLPAPGPRPRMRRGAFQCGVLTAVHDGGIPMSVVRAVG
jgi:hypothetical protein